MEASKTLGARARGTARSAAGAAQSAGPVTLMILLLGTLGAILLVITEFSTIVTVDVLTTGTCEEIADPEVRDACSVSGFEQHGGALILLGLAAFVMTLGAARGSSRPASVALIVIALVVAGIVILRDVPAAGETGLVGLRYEQANAGATTGLYLECAAAALCAAAGALRLARGRSA